MVGSSALAAQTDDPFGAPVVIERTRWHKVVIANHPELAGEVEAVVEAIRRPTRVDSDPLFSARRRFFAPHPKLERWVMALISYEHKPARLVSAALLRSEPIPRVVAP